MFQIPAGLKKADVSLVADGNYYSVISNLLKDYRQLIWISMFIIDLNTANKNFLKVHQLLLDLKNADWEGSNVKVLVSGSKDNIEIASTSLTTFEYIKALKIPCKTCMTVDKQPNHSKIMIIDDMVLLGSHNWSPGAFSNQHQDSVLIKSKEFSSYCKLLFLYQWTKKIN
jgi:phosphatidylserine/phosphatidylglycerophosphate/cardiolipin synthase-like enzyme